jgi:hypothetical protein
MGRAGTLGRNNRETGGRAGGAWGGVPWGARLGARPWEIERREGALVAMDWGRGGMRLIPGARSPAESDG